MENTYDEIDDTSEKMKKNKQKKNNYSIYPKR